MKHNRIKELWINRPWVYIPTVVKFMKKYPFAKDGNLRIWIKNCFYLNWQVCFKRNGGWGLMKLGKAMAIFLDIENEEYSDEEKEIAIYHVMNMTTHMSINKDAMIKAIKWLWHKHYEWIIPADKLKEDITNDI